MKRSAAATILLLGGMVSVRGDDWWNLPPIRYAESEPRDVISRLAADGNWKFKAAGAPARVKEILAALDIPESSQILVFSKTSLQRDLIGPRSPRAIWFSENAYAAWVPGGTMETITHDPLIGPVYHVVDLREKPYFKRETDECFSCHGGSRTEDVPGVFVRSTFPDETGRLVGSLGSFEVDATTPLGNRWGGYFVTGNSSLAHLGNRIFLPDKPAAENSPAPDVREVVGKPDFSPYPRTTSDVVALLVLEHQCKVYNLATAAAWRYRRAAWTSQVFGTSAETADCGADHDARTIADALLFRDAAPLGDGVEGDEAFQRDFRAQFPETADGRSLADFHLGGRLFRHRCSYMVYSAACAGLPPRVKSAVARRLHGILEEGANAETYAYLGEKERAAIAAILRETWPPYAAAK